MTKENIIKAFHEFNKIHGHYPSAKEIDADPSLPTSRLIQRRYGGLVRFRKSIGLPVNEINLNSGDARSTLAGIINRRANDLESEVYKKLVEIFGNIYVQPEFPFQLGINKNRCDYHIIKRDGTTFIVDIFFAKDRHNFLGCLNHKINKYKDCAEKIETYFVSMNDEIDIVDAMKKKKIKLPDHQKVIGYKEFLILAQKIIRMV